MNYQVVSKTYEFHSDAGKVRVRVETSNEVVAWWTCEFGLQATCKKHERVIETHGKQLAEACFRLHLAPASQMSESIKGPLLAFLVKEDAVEAQVGGEKVAEWAPLSGLDIALCTPHRGALLACPGLGAAMAEFYCRQRPDLLPEQPRWEDPDLLPEQTREASSDRL